MPGYVLNQPWVVTCAHAGTGQAAPAPPRVKIMGQPVLTENATHTTFAGCTFTTPAGAPLPCAMAKWTPGTGATRVKVLKSPVLITSSVGLAPNTGGSVTPAPTPGRVKAI